MDDGPHMPGDIFIERATRKTPTLQLVALVRSLSQSLDLTLRHLRSSG
jgi:hypothetical protein